LGSLTSYEREVDTANKFNNYFKIRGIINNTFQPHKTLKTIIKLYNTLAVPALIYGSEN
jgi:hypothetical protein